MKWSHARDGDTRPWRVRFAWFPTEIYDPTDDRWVTIWLERYTEQQTYVVKQRPTKFGYKILCGAWESQRKLIVKV
jgi:hypothetical protein